MLRVASQYARAKSSIATASVMQIFSGLRIRKLTSLVPGSPVPGMKSLILAGVASFLILGALSAPTEAQTLARPGWAGSGLDSDRWWDNAIFYRIDVAHFQDSDGDGIGDLPGIAQRLDYLQSLGVDAIVIPAPSDEGGFNELLREAGSHRIRIIIALEDPSRGSTTPQTLSDSTAQPASVLDSEPGVAPNLAPAKTVPDAASKPPPSTPALPAQILGQARVWLTRGAAGISLEASLPSTPALLRDLRNLTDSFPGQRILLAHPGSGEKDRAQLLAAELSAAELVSTPIYFPANLPETFPPDLRASLNGPKTPSVPLLESEAEPRRATALAADPSRSDGLQKIIAARLLATHGAVSLLYGQELGLRDDPAPTGPTVMQWTPSNITPPAPPQTDEEAVKPAPRTPEDAYGTFKPYVLPPPAKKPLAPGEAPSPDTLPGFTSGQLAAHSNSTQPGTNAAANAAAENTDPKSLLNFYRRLIQLHHANSSLRSGMAYVLDHDTERALVWIRRAPAGARTAATIVIACNLSDKALTLSLDADLTRLQMPSGTLRPLLASWTATPIAQYSGHIVLPPYSVYIAELSH